jgi:isopenicillin N synthase-like dioxygenase
MTQLSVLSLAQPPDEFAAAIGKSFQETGFALVTDHGLDPQLVARGWEMTKRFFAQSEEEKRLYADQVAGGQRGYIPFGREIAKDAKVHDLKEFWHVGRDVAGTDPDAHNMPRNIWPEEPADFRESLSALYTAMDNVGATILSRIALYLGLPENWFDSAIHNGNSILRLLHYPPIIDAPKGAIRAGAHEDINLITLLLGAEEAGLQLLTREGEWMDANPPEGALVINVGDMLQRLTNHQLPSTTHRVINPASHRSGHSRYSMPFFLHLRSDFPIKTLDQCITDENPNRYPDPILADDYLHQRLVEIGLIKA